jgi:cell division protein FtsB
MKQDQNGNRDNSREVISRLNQQIFSLKKQVQSASLEMAMMRAQMDDLKRRCTPQPEARAF